MPRVTETCGDIADRQQSPRGADSPRRDKTAEATIEAPASVRHWTQLSLALREHGCANPSQLVRLTVTRVGLEDVGSDLSVFSALSTLDLSSNALTTLPRALFEQLPSLSALDVSGNALCKLSKRVARLTKLERLRVDCNKLQTVPLDALMTLPRLKCACVCDNYIDAATLLGSSHERHVVANVLCPGIWQQRIPNRVEAEPRLFIGSIEATSDANALRKLGITHVLSVGVSPADVHEDSFATLRIPLADWPREQLQPHIALACNFIDEGLRPGKACLVHCLAGASRSASMVLAWLILRRGMGFDEALTMLRRSRFCVCPNLGFQQQLRDLARSISTGRS